MTSLGAWARTKSAATGSWGGHRRRRTTSTWEINSDVGMVMEWWEEEMDGVVEPSPDASIAAAAQIGRERDKGEREQSDREGIERSVDCFTFT